MFYDDDYVKEKLLIENGHFEETFSSTFISFFFGYFFARKVSPITKMIIKKITSVCENVWRERERETGEEKHVASKHIYIIIYWRKNDKN